jgi:secreted PhoX family phosphatase
MSMSFHDDDEVCNTSTNPTFAEVTKRALSRRTVLEGSLSLAGFAFLGCGEKGIEGIASELEEGLRPGTIAFRSIPISTQDTVVVPEGYRADVLYAWGDPISDGPAFAQDASNTAVDQQQQAGMHHDGMHYFPLERGREASRHGLLVINHEYADDGLLHVGGMVPWTAEKVAKSQAAHGVSVIEVRLGRDGWTVVRPSRYARRITTRTPMRIGGPLAGHPRMRTAADPSGTAVLGTLNNCSHGHTPWGTYLTCEENWSGYFVNPIGDVPGASPEDKAIILRDQARYGITAAGDGYRWHEHDLRFDASQHPHEPSRFGWVTEIDPFDPESVPVKRTAMGRIKHEGACIVETRDGRVVAYMGDDGRFEYIYKFVSKYPWRRARAAGASPLDEGTLYVARFDADGVGAWVELAFGKNGLDAATGFGSQADVLIETRRAADVVGATKMDRPEWISSRPGRGHVYCSMTNNNRRGNGTDPAIDPANPRADNIYGHIIRWRESLGDHAAVSFRWEFFVLAGDPAHATPSKQGDIQGDIFGCPDGLLFDRDGRLWVQTDASTSAVATADYANIGNNQMVAMDPDTRQAKRFLTGPRGAEITGALTTPDGRTMFVNIQHPGEPTTDRHDPAAPTALSTWPDGASAGRPRAATIAIRKNDGGVIGT